MKLLFKFKMLRFSSAKTAAVLLFTALSLTIISFVPGVLCHGKLYAPIGSNVSPQVAPSSQSDVSIGVTGLSPCGTTLGRPFNRDDKRPRAEYYPGQTAELEWRTVNQDGGGPLRIRFSGDGGYGWADANIVNNVPGIIGLDASSLPIIGKDKSHTIKVKIPNMECPPGKCMMTVSNPLTFGSCTPVSIQSGNSGRNTMTYTSTGGKMSGGAKGLMAGGLGGILDAVGL